MKHLRIAQELKDKVGEGRACWSLGNAHTALGKNEEALRYASKHLEISREVGGCVHVGFRYMDLLKLLPHKYYSDDPRN